ncbi:hypothetical protein A4305_04555 [Campylobacter jejuni]|nr:hypothetical protein [Campylobacter jejuni]EAL9719033.1 hypothetical protein [Campylobacter jejuni]
MDDKILYVDFKNILLNFDQKMQIYAKAGDGASSYFPDLNNWEYNFFGGFFGDCLHQKLGEQILIIFNLNLGKM